MESDMPNETTGHEEFVPEDDAIIGRAFRWSVVFFVLVGLAGGGIYLATREVEEKEEITEKEIGAIEVRRTDDIAFPEIRFTDITLEAGIDFVHESGARGEKLLPETMGGGCAFFDFDGDGDQDLLLVNGKLWPPEGGSPEGGRSAESSALTRLYRNDGTGNFMDVTEEMLGVIEGYGFGPAVGDFDNDGDVDFFVAGLGGNRLFRNEGTTAETAIPLFVEVTEQAGVGGEGDRWSSSAGFFDYDRDGWLDLFVCNYVEWSREIDLELDFTLNGTDRAYGPPTNYRGTHSYLYHNNGDGTFTDVSEQAGIQVANPATVEAMGKGLALAPVDFDGDGWMDVIVANDTVQNFLFRNRGDGTFEEIGDLSGLAFGSDGNATGAMGIDVGAYRNDEDLGVAIGNFANEMTSLYVTQGGSGFFSDESIGEGIGAPSRLKLSFGLFFFDVDLDGRLDLLQANGHLEETINEIQPSQRYRQSAQLFWNVGPEHRSCFAEMPATMTGDLGRPIVGRGVAYADIDGDGDLDVLLTQTGGRPMLLRNDQELGHHWLRVRVVGSEVEGNRDAIGAWVELELADGEILRRQVMPTRSYLSQVELPVTFGLGARTKVKGLRVIWPDGTEREVGVEGVDRLLVVEK